MTRFCTQCGATVNESARFCKKCGAKLIATQPAQPGAPPGVTYQNPPGYQPPQDYGQPPYQTPYQYPYQSSAGGDLKQNIAALLCYPLSFITGILFLVLTPYNRDYFVRFHAYQSIFFFLGLLALKIVLGVISIVTPWFIDNLFSTGMNLLALGGTGWMMYQAYQGNRFKLPIVGDMAENQASKP